MDTPTLRERLDAPEIEDSLEREIDAIMANPDLVESLSSDSKTVVPTRDQVSHAWRSITPEDRRIWRVGYGLDGHGKPQTNQFARAINRTGPNVPLRLEQIRAALYDFIWREGGFYGLTGRAQVLLKRAEVYTPADLLKDPKAVLSRARWGAGIYAELNQWMIEHGYPSLDDELPGDLRLKFRINTF